MNSSWRDYVRQGRRRIEVTIATLDKLSRQRALTLHESLELERAITAESYSRRTWLAWQAEEDAKARELRQQGLGYASIARVLSRTPDAVAARLRTLKLKSQSAGANGPSPENCGARPDNG